MGLLTILHQDHDIVVINKPSALLVHRNRQARDHVFALQLLRDQLGHFVYPVHRLDRATSGVLLFAKSSEIAAKLVESFTARKVSKTYHAVVRGYTDEEGLIDHPLAESSDDEAKEARTRFRRLATAEIDEPIDPHDSIRISLLEAFPETGRMHQLRKHFKHISHPILGDTTYGKGPYNRFLRDRFFLNRLMLHASELSFPHPATGNKTTISAPTPPEFRPFFNEMGWSAHIHTENA